MSEFVPWIERRNAENWVLMNSDLIESLREASRTVTEVFKILKDQGYASESSIRKTLKVGEQQGIIQRTASHPGHYATFNVTEFGVELYNMVVQGRLPTGF
jgi:Fe2+ or Zn2+ uptake regulation protein